MLAGNIQDERYEGYTVLMFFVMVLAGLRRYAANLGLSLNKAQN